MDLSGKCGKATELGSKRVLTRTTAIGDESGIRTGQSSTESGIESQLDRTSASTSSDVDNQSNSDTGILNRVLETTKYSIGVIRDYSLNPMSLNPFGDSPEHDEEKL